MKKGAELAVNTMIIAILAFVVLITVIALITGVWQPSASGLNIESAKNNACRQLISSGCSYSYLSIIKTDVDLNGDNIKDDLQTLCNDKFGCKNADTNKDGKVTDPEKQDCCMRICGCK